MPQRALVSDIERAAVDHPRSRVGILYFIITFISLLIGAIVLRCHIVLIISLILINITIIELLLYSTKLWKRRKIKGNYFTKNPSTHLFSLFACSVFAAPFIGVMAFNESDKFLSGTPFSLISLIAFGYLGACFCLGIPAIFIINGIRTAIKRKRHEERMIQLSREDTLIESYDSETHGEVRETKRLFPRIFIAISILFVVSGILVLIGGIVLTFISPIPSEVPAGALFAGIIVLVSGLVLIIVGWLCGRTFFKARIDKKRFDSEINDLYNGAKAFVKTARITHFTRKSILTREFARYVSCIAYVFDYVFYDDNKLCKRTGYVVESTKSGYFFSIGVPQAHTQEHPLEDFNPRELKIVFNENISAVLGVVLNSSEAKD